MSDNIPFPTWQQEGIRWKRNRFAIVHPAGTAYSPLSNESEESTARLCDSGLPDPDVCDVLITPSIQKDILEEAWARGCAPHTFPPPHSLHLDSCPQRCTDGSLCSPVCPRSVLPGFVGFPLSGHAGISGMCAKLWSILLPKGYLSIRTLLLPVREV